MLTILLGLLFAPQDSPQTRPTQAQVEQAHQLFRGEWDVVMYVDDGEPIGPRLLRSKMAKDGRVQVSDRAFRIVDPVTNETRVVPFRVDPSQQPRQIEVTGRDDRTLAGIYRFDGEDLVLCLESFPDVGRPSAFEAPEGSRRLLIQLRMVDRQAKAAAAPAAPETTEAPARAATPADQAARATFASMRRPTESELTRVRDLFAGNWEITSVVDDGDQLGQELVRRRFAEDGRIRFGTRSFAIVNPVSNVRRLNSYRVDPTRDPSEIDVTTQFDTVLKGIYRFENDRLTVCLAKDEEAPRPDSFEAPGGSDRMLVRMRLANDTAEPRTAQAPVAAPAPIPAPAPVAVPVAPPSAGVAVPATDDDQVRRLVVGSWTTTDTKGTLTAVFHPDGQFAASRNWSRTGKRLFGPPTDSSSGPWSYNAGRLTAFVGRTTDKRVAGHQFDVRIQSIGEDTMVVSDPFGTISTFKRLR